MPYCYPDRAGEPYRPSNGTEGMMFEEEFCSRCVKQDGPDGDSMCSVWDAAMFFSADEPDYPKELVWSPEGHPICKAFDDGTKEKHAPRCPDTKDMFE